MSRLDELKKQYPHLNMSFFDLMVRMDNTKTYKYLPLLCKLFSKRFDLKTLYNNPIKASMEIKESLQDKNINVSDLTGGQACVLNELVQFQNGDLYSIFPEFCDYMERGKIQNKDITSYDSIEEIRMATSLASIKEMDEEMSKQVIKEHEDDTWLVVRPLTFAASSRYGASTKWCTTYKSEKQYFEKYWRQGVLAYFLNKKTGYKFAMFKDVNDNDLSFWNAADMRTDFLSLEIDDYLIPIVRALTKSRLTNKNLSSDEIQKQVHIECLGHEFKSPSMSVEIAIPRSLEREVEVMNGENSQDIGGDILGIQEETVSERPVYQGEMEMIQRRIPVPISNMNNMAEQTDTVDMVYRGDN